MFGSRPPIPLFARFSAVIAVGEVPRFIADAMLGSLSRWLRLLGFDTLYFQRIDDSELIRRALRDGRIILTRDTAVAATKNFVRCILVSSDEIVDQARQVLHESGGESVQAPPRCPRCNGSLASLGRADVVDEVPEHVRRLASVFLMCQECRHVYWEGSHRKGIDERIRTIVRWRGAGCSADGSKESSIT